MQFMGPIQYQRSGILKLHESVNRHDGPVRPAIPKCQRVNGKHRFNKYGRCGRCGESKT